MKLELEIPTEVAKQLDDLAASIGSTASNLVMGAIHDGFSENLHFGFFVRVRAASGSKDGKD